MAKPAVGRIVLCAVALVTGMTASSIAPAITILGVGAGVSCGKWTSEREAGGGPYTNRTQWVVGYLSGMAMATNTDVLAPAAVDISAIVGWIDNYCRTNPLHNIGEAADELFQELKKRHRR